MQPLVPSVSKLVEAAQQRHGLVEYAAAALAVVVALRIVRQRADDFDAVFRVKLRDVPEALRVEYDEVRAHDGVHAGLRRVLKQPAEARIHLRRAARYVEHGNVLRYDGAQAVRGDLARHYLLTVGAA